MQNQASLQETKQHGAVRFPFNLYPCTIPGDFQQVALHWHESMELVFVKQGMGLVQVGVVTYPAYRGDIFIFAPGTLHALRQAEGQRMEYENIIFEPELLGGAEDLCAEKYLLPLQSGRLSLPVRLTPNDLCYLQAAACLRERGAEALWREASFRISLMTKGEVWRFRADIPLRRELKAQRAARFARMPLVSVVVPLYNTPPKFLREMMRSVLGQTYAGLELVLADASDAAHGEVEKAVRAVRDARVRYIRLAKNGGIAENTNAALAAAQGEYIALLDHDDVLTPNALYEAVKAVNEQGADFVYSDEIVLDSTLKKLGEYHFKPDFSPDTLRGCNYITHLAVFSRALLA